MSQSHSEKEKKPEATSQGCSDTSPQTSSSNGTTLNLAHLREMDRETITLLSSQHAKDRELLLRWLGSPKCHTPNWVWREVKQADRPLIDFPWSPPWKQGLSRNNHCEDAASSLLRFPQVCSSSCALQHNLWAAPAAQSGLEAPETSIRGTAVLTLRTKGHRPEHLAPIAKGSKCSLGWLACCVPARQLEE